MNWKHSYTDILICPHCQYEHYDCWELCDSVLNEKTSEVQCESCEKWFEYMYCSATTWSSREIEAQDAKQEDGE